MVAGVLVGACAGLLGATLRITRGQTPEARVFNLEGEMRRLRAEVDDTLEKATHLHDRIRKRTAFTRDHQVEDAQPQPILDRKAELRRRWREHAAFAHPVR